MGKGHARNEDTYLDKNGSNEVTAANAKDAIDKKHSQNSDSHLGTVDQDISMNTHKITDVVDPTSDQDAATKKYVDSKVVPTEIFFRAEPDSNYGDYRVQSIAGAGSHRFTISAPCNFTSLVHAVLVFSPVSTIAAGQVVDIHTDYAKLGENYQAHSEDVLGVTISGNADEICHFHLCAALSNLSTNDVVGILVDLKSIGTTIKVYGIILEFN